MLGLVSLAVFGLCFVRKIAVVGSGALYFIVGTVVLSTVFGVSLYQIAYKPGHRPSEPLFVIKSVFAQYQKNIRGLILTRYDIWTFLL